MKLTKYLRAAACGISVAVLAESIDMEPFSEKWWGFVLSVHTLWYLAGKYR